MNSLGMSTRLAILLAVVCLSACGPRRAPSPARINHIVFVSLNDRDDYKEILIDSDALLSTIPSVKTYSAGPHMGTGRDTIIDDYDLAIVLGFDTREELAAYVAHEQHVRYVTKWKPRLSSLRVYDMLDQSDTPIPSK